MQKELGEALYGPSEEGYCSWGEHIAETLAPEAAKEIARLRAEREWCKGWVRELVRLFPLGLAEGPVRRLEKRLLGEP